MNNIIVYEGNIYGLPEDTSKLKQDVTEIKEKGVRAPFGFLDAVTDYLAAKIEEEIAQGLQEGYVQVKMAKSPSDVNVKVSGKGRRYIISNNRQISLKGPVFAAASYRII